MMNNEVTQVNEKLLSYNELEYRTVYVVVVDPPTSNETFYIKNESFKQSDPQGIVLDKEGVLPCYWPYDLNEKIFRKARPEESITIRNSPFVS